MIRELIGGFRKPMEEVIHRLVDLVVELVGDGRIEEAEKQAALVTPGVPVMHQGKGPAAANPESNRHLLLWLRRECGDTYSSLTMGNRG
jgi:hypothetical protein